MKYGILMHEADDDVGVAVLDLVTGEKIGVATLEGDSVDTIEMAEDVPLGHKVAIRNIAENKKVIEYGRPIGRASQKINMGRHVHVHNLKTLRWKS